MELLKSSKNLSLIKARTSSRKVNVLLMCLKYGAEEYVFYHISRSQPRWYSNLQLLKYMKGSLRMLNYRHR